MNIAHNCSSTHMLHANCRINAKKIRLQTHKGMNRLEDLPMEVLCHVLSYVGGGDLAVVAQCSHKLYNALQVQAIWKSRCVSVLAIT